MLEVGYKTLFLLSLVLVAFTYLFPEPMMYLANQVEFTVDSIQLWRLVSSFLLPSIGQYAIINFLFNFYILYMFMPDQVLMTTIRKKNIQQPTSSWKS
jgi:hypothetical protein